MIERQTYTVAVDPDDSAAERVEQLMEQVMDILGIGSVQCDASFVCPDCGTEWPTRECLPCLTLQRAEGKD